MLNEIELSKMVQGGVPFPMLSDETGSIGKAYGVYDEQLGTTLRGTFIIDPEGYIHAVEILTTPVGRSTTEILRQLQAFQLFKSNNSLVPADWNPGGKTLTDSMDLVGKISTVWKPEY